MVLNEEKRAKLADALTRRQGVSGAVGTSAPHTFVSATAAPSSTPSTPIATLSLLPPPMHHPIRLPVIEG